MTFPTKWEYLCVEGHIADINELGVQGWELAAAVRVTYNSDPHDEDARTLLYLKRHSLHPNFGNRP